MITVLEIIGVIIALYLCDKIRFIAENLSYREKYQNSIETRLAEGKHRESLYKEIEKMHETIIKLQGDNIALQKLNAHHLRELEKHLPK